MSSLNEKGKVQQEAAENLIIDEKIKFMVIRTKVKEIE